MTGEVTHIPHSLGNSPFLPLPERGEQKKGIYHIGCQLYIKLLLPYKNP